MLNIDEINKEIERLEHKDYLTYDICNKLAMLYIVKDHMAGTASSGSMIPQSASALSIK